MFSSLNEKNQILDLLARTPNGFVKYEAGGTLDFLANERIICVVPHVKAAYFSPNVIEKETLHEIFQLFHGIACEGIGVGFHTSSGYHWLVIDPDRYRTLAEEYGVDEFKYRIYPAE